MTQSNRKPSTKKGRERKMPAVLPLEKCKGQSTSKKNHCHNDNVLKKFYKENIGDIVALETNYSGVKEFEAAIKKKKRTKR